MYVFRKFKKTTNIALRKIYTTNLLFSLHCRISFWFLLGCAVLVGSREFIKEHINCISEEYLKHVINTYCFVSTTFTVLKYHNSSNNVEVNAHPGVGPFIAGEDPIIRHAYYQWVPFVLVLQALMFYLPYSIWKYLENGRLKAIVQAMSTSPLISSKEYEINGYKIESEELRNKKVILMKETYLTFSRFRVNRDWARSLVFCETLNVLNIILQIALVNMFLQGKFLNLGIEWMKNSNNILDLVFPKVTKCTFRKYGASGSLQLHDTICVMSLNIINEKIYCTLWFWFLILFIVTCMGLIWRILTFILHKSSPAFNKWIWGELSPGPALKEKDILVITRKLCFSDWLFLHYLGKNINGAMFRKIVSNISESLQSTSVPIKENYVLLKPKSSPSLSHKDNESFC